MKTTIRRAERAEMPFVFALIEELADYENEPDQVKTSVEGLIEDGYCENPLFKVVFAEVDGDIAGMVFYYFGYSTWKGKMLYIEDIVVTERLRRNGIGKQLFDFMRREARKENAKQIRFHVLDWNAPAINFYKKNGVSLDGDWILCKLEDKEI